MKDSLPEWAVDYKAKHGGTLRKRGNAIYYYKKTSRREKTGEPPVSYEKYMGILTEEHGLIPPQRTLIDTNRMSWAEYGWTKVILTLCPETWKKACGNDAEEILHACIISESPNSMLKFKYPSGFSDKQIETRVKTQKTSLYRRLLNECGINHKELDIFKNLLVLFDKSGHVILTQITDEMNSLANIIHIDLQVVDTDEIKFNNAV